ncbi:MAG: hypothetical protein FJ009_22535, partial [Chloroflexi bacterium]|nr:hypothetical protein [Chloroflexota bacterium]
MRHLTLAILFLALALSSCVAQRRAPTPSANTSPAPTSDSTKSPAPTAPSTTTIQRVNESTPLFKRANIPGFTDIQEGTNGIAL